MAMDGRVQDTLARDPASDTHLRVLVNTRTGMAEKLLTGVLRDNDTKNLLDPFHNITSVSFHDNYKHFQ